MKKLPYQDSGHHTTTTKIHNYLCGDCGLLTGDKFGKIFEFNDGTEYHNYGMYECYLKGETSEYVNVNEGNGKFFGNVSTLNNEQIIDTMFRHIVNVAHLSIQKFSMKNSIHNNTNNHSNCIVISKMLADVCIVGFGGNHDDNEYYGSRGGKKIQVQDEIVQRLYSFLTLGYTDHKFVTNKLKTERSHVTIIKNSNELTPVVFEVNKWLSFQK